MSQDRIVYSFIVGWVLLIALLIALDWLGNPNRGGFRPKGERPARNRLKRKAERTRRRSENDAAVRTTLRDAYGASSLRLTWSGEQEDKSRQIDDSLVVVERTGDVLDATSHEVVELDHTSAVGDPLPNLDEAEPVSPQAAVETTGELADELAVASSHDDAEGSAPPPPEPEPEPEPIASGPPERPVGWAVGVDPHTLTTKGIEPTAATIRTRVWKNHGTAGAWDGINRERLRTGKPPRRTNPITGSVECATVDPVTARASWGDEPIDPFGNQA
jgi:hypothetical protein